MRPEERDDADFDVVPEAERVDDVRPLLRLPTRPFADIRLPADVRPLALDELVRDGVVEPAALLPFMLVAPFARDEALLADRAFPLRIVVPLAERFERIPVRDDLSVVCVLKILSLLCFQLGLQC